MNAQDIEKPQAEPEYVVVGKVLGHFGVKGWLKVQSFTRPPLEILTHREWSLVLSRSALKGRSNLPDRVSRCDETLGLKDGRWHGKGLIAKLESIDSREKAERLIGATVVVKQDQFADLDDGEYYWTDLVGLTVRNRHGVEFGVVDHLVETGANDVLVVHKLPENEQGSVVETLIPWSDRFVLEVRLEDGEMLVDWDAG